MVAPAEAHDTPGRQTCLGSLTSALGDGAGQVVDLSANRTTFELSGPRARAVLEKGCAAGPAPARSSRPGRRCPRRSATSRCVLLEDRRRRRYRIFPRASFADFLGRWLLDAMREYASPEVP